jgi:WXG100 family type VII secretion target
MAFEGMDIQAVRSLAGQLDQQASHIQDAVNQTSGLVGQLEGAWQGPDAQEFRGWWEQQHRPHMMACHDAISGLAQSARNNAQAQEDASRG